MTAISESDAMALQVTDVTKHYDSGFTLDDVTFDLPKGYIMGLIGPNGAGKSTLIKLILNMIHRDAGSIHVLGLDNIANEEPVKEQLGVVFDFSYMHEQWQVKNIERIVAPLYPSWDGGCYRKYLDTFGLGDAQNGKKHIKDLSRGMQMKLMLAIALSHDAKLLILSTSRPADSMCLPATNSWISCMPTLRMANIRYCSAPISLPTSNVLLTSLPTSPMAASTTPVRKTSLRNRSA